jgi:tol-pal system protein YbgF
LACSLILVGLSGACASQTAQHQLDARVSDQNTSLAEMRREFAALRNEVQRKHTLLSETEQRVKQERADHQVLIDDLRTEIQQMRGIQQEFNHQLNLMNVELQKLRAGGDKPSLATGGKQETDIVLYEQILKIITDEKDYRQAISKFRVFIDKYPASPLSDNAAYWIGEAFFAEQRYKEAIVEYQNVVERWPKGDKVCAARLKQGICFDHLGESKQAKLFLDETVSRCANQPEGKRAREVLQRLAKPK